MGGRMLPTECEHGVTVDGGDFCRSERCPKCDAISTWHAEDARLAAAVVEAAIAWCQLRATDKMAMGENVVLGLAVEALLGHREQKP